MNYNITTNNYNRDFSKPFHLKLEPWQITGFTDGEGSFICSILNTGKGSTRVKLEFKIAQKAHSEGVLSEIQNYFGCGSVVIDNRKTNTKKISCNIYNSYHKYNYTPFWEISLYYF